MQDLNNQVALVTGASRGIGRAIAVTLAKAGAKVILNYQGNEKAALETLEMVREAGAEGIIYKTNVADVSQVEKMFKDTLEQYGRLDILVNNAGITRDGLLMRMKEEDWNQVIQTNLTGAFNCIKAASKPMMKQRRGKIINISSVIGIIGNGGQANYAAAKAGLIGLTKSVAKELATRGIMVNAVAPGYIETDMTEQIGEEVKGQLLTRIPSGRLGNPVDVANLVLFLAGQGSDYITGQVISVDGGMVMS